MQEGENAGRRKCRKVKLRERENVGEYTGKRKCRKEKLREGENAAKRKQDRAERRKGKKNRFCGTAVRMCLLCIAVWLLGYKPAPVNSVTFLDVGQGDCILVRTSSGQNYLFDCGSTSRSKVGKYVLIPYLKYNGIQNIDGVFVSHPDADHMNGVLELLAEGRENHIRIGQLILPAIEEKAREEQLGKLMEAAKAASREEPVHVGFLSAGESWDCGGAAFTCLHPARDYSGENSNAYSECIYVIFREKQNGAIWTMLLTGDVEDKGEEALYQELVRSEIEGVSVLKAAHHGSRNSTSEELLELLTPELTVISSGRNNRYGHPHAELLERLEDSGTYIVQTAQAGAITVTGGDGKIRIQVYCLP